MKEIISHIWQIAKKDLIEFSRDRIRLVTFVIMPIFMMVLTGFIFPSQTTLKDVPIGIARLDNDQTSEQLIKALKDLSMKDSQPAFNVKTYQSEDEVKEGIKKQEISGGLIVPEDFSAKLAANEQAQIIIIEDQANPQISAITTQVLEQVVNTFSQQIGTQKVGYLLQKEKVVPLGEAVDKTALAFLKPITTKLLGLIEGETNYFEFVAPGIMAMVVMTAVMTGLAGSVSREKEQGTLDGILISPISRLAIILGKATSQSIRGLAQGVIVLILAILLFGVKIYGSLLLVFLLLILGIFSFVGLGILVSASAAEQETATQILFMFQFPMLFLSGVFFPIQQMPKIMQQISHLVPLTYAIEALRKVMILGAGFTDIRTELIILFSFGLITLAIAMPLFRRMITR